MRRRLRLDAVGAGGHAVGELRSAPRRRGAPPRHDARREGRPDDAGRARRAAARVGHQGLLPRLGPQRGRLRAARQDGARLGRDVRPLPVVRAADAPAHPAPLRGRRGARPQQRRRSRRLPPQHRPRLHAQCRARGARREGHGRGSGGDRDRLDVLALHRRRARRALGPDLRELRRDARARLRDGRGGGPGLPVGRDPRLPQALPRRRRHHRGTRPGRHPARRDGTAGHSPAGLPGGDRRGRRLRDGLFQQLERAEDARQQVPAHRRAQGRAGASAASS